MGIVSFQGSISNWSTCVYSFITLKLVMMHKYNVKKIFIMGDTKIVETFPPIFPTDGTN